MAKRFIDTEIFNDEWFMDLSKDAKLFYIYYITNCDHAGILKLNLRIAEIQTGIKSIQTVIEQLSNCLLTLKPNVYLMPAFIKYQYPNFPKSNVKQQDSVLKILSIYGIDEEKIKSYLTVSKELNNTYDNVSVTETVINLKVEDKKSEPKPPEELHPLQTYVKDKFERVSKLEKQLTFEECEKLLKKYTKPQISKVLVSMENWKGINKKVSVYLTLLNWLDKEYDNQDATIPPKKELKEIPASYIFNDVKIDYGNYPHNED
jgi:hypothetical protein